MATKTDKKNAIRQEIIDHFLHLTGVATNLSANDFYKNAKKAK